MRCPWNRMRSPKTACFVELANALAGACVLAMTIVTAGCHQPRTGLSDQTEQTASGRPVQRRTVRDPIRHLLCLYEHKPWLNLDMAGDNDPEGIEYRVFLLTGSSKGVLREGTFHIEMYWFQRDSEGGVERTLASDWHYPTTVFQTVRGVLGMGYHIGLRWATKAMAGSEIELITRFEDVDGRSVRSATKRLRVPKYAS